MASDLHRKLQALFLVLLGLVLGKKIWDLSILYYIHQRFIPLTILAVIILFWLAQNLTFSGKKRKLSGTQAASGHEEPLAEECSHCHNHQNPHAHSNHISGILFVLIPILLGALPSSPLSVNNAFNKELVLTAPLTTNSSEKRSTFTIPPEQRSMMDWFDLLDSAENPALYIGDPVRLSGTVLTSAELPEDQFFLTRLLITCCVADAIPIGILIEASDGGPPPDGTWIRVEGTMDLIGQTLSQPLVRATAILPIDPPSQPYITQ